MVHPNNFLASVSANLGYHLSVNPKAVASALTIILVALVVVGCLPLLRRLFTKLHPGGDATQLVKMIMLVVAYSLCSSMLLIINKVAVTYIPAASSILLCQFASCSAFIQLLKQTKVLNDVESIQYEKAKSFMLLALAFVAILFCNVKALQYNPVDTIICLRSSAPLLIAIIEFYYLGRELPSTRSWLSLLGVMAGVIVYVRHDIHFGLQPYSWLLLWYFFAVFDMVFVKHICNTVEMSTWTRTYYQNILSIPPMLIIAFFNGDYKVINGPLPSIGISALVLSCVAGLGMSYFSFALRAAISATSFSVVGNVCKILTIVVNLLIWDEHADTVGTIALFGCLLVGSFYKEAPLKRKGDPTSPLSKDEKHSDVEAWSPRKVKDVEKSPRRNKDAP